MTFGLLTTGFSRKRLEDIKSDVEARLRQAFGDNIDLRSESVFGQIVGVLLRPLTELWELSEHVYLALDPDFAEGTALDAIAAYSGITRLPALSTSVIAAVIGDSGTVLPAGSIAKNTESGDLYVLATAMQITASRMVRARVGIADLEAAGTYVVTIGGIPVTYDADCDPTAAEIAEGLAAEIAYLGVMAEADGDELVLTADALDTPFIASLSDNLEFTELASPGDFAAQETGPLSLPAGTLDAIVTPVAGWTSITNIEAGLTGRDIESDVALRLRRRKTIGYTATTTLDAIQARLLDLESVLNAIVVENNTDATDGNGVPAHTIWAIVLGGDPADIGQVLYERHAAGIGTHGDQDVVITAESGQEFTLHFDRPTEVPVYIDITLEKGSDYPVDGDDLIKAALAAYGLASVSIGDSLVYSRLYTPINAVAGHEVTDLRIGTSPSPTGTATIAAALNELLRLDPDNITIAEAP